MANRQKFSIEEATKLRIQGHSYQSIAEVLGCSVHWCLKNLKGVEKGAYIENDETKRMAIEILEDALLKLRAL